MNKVEKRFGVLKELFSGIVSTRIETVTYLIYTFIFKAKKP